MTGHNAHDVCRCGRPKDTRARRCSTCFATRGHRGGLSDLEYLLSRVTKMPGDDGCWEWNGPRHPFGYGAFARGQKVLGAHRVSWELHNGPIPPRMQVCHRCDNPPCVRPDHLFLGTTEENTADRHAKGRSSAGEAHGRITALRTPRGEDNPAARLTERDVLAIRQAHAAGVTQTALARQFGVTQATVSGIVLRKTWLHV